MREIPGRHLTECTESYSCQKLLVLLVLLLVLAIFRFLLILVLQYYNNT